MTEKELFRVNNFDLIRLFAALEVAIHHTLQHFDFRDNLVYQSTGWLPGVPIFFFVSGFLISKSYESNPRIAEYARNRALRIYPALIACTILSVLSVFVTGYLSSQSWTISGIVFWVISQMTVFQFYGPDFMRSFGSGVLNGSLWTVTVELQFYVLIPVIYWILSKAVNNKSGRQLVLIGMILFFSLTNVVNYQLHEHHSELTIAKFAYVSFVSWIYMFLIGVLSQQNFLILYHFVKGKAIQFVVGYVILVALYTHFLNWPTGNDITPILFPFLALAILSLAYTAPYLSDRLLHKNDISYGVYIYHMPIINIMMYYGLTSKIVYVFAVIIITIVIASLSWICLERIAIRKKKHPLVVVPASPLKEFVN